MYAQVILVFGAGYYYSCRSIDELRHPRHACSAATAEVRTGRGEIGGSRVVTDRP